MNKSTITLGAKGPVERTGSAWRAWHFVVRDYNNAWFLLPTVQISFGAEDSPYTVWKRKTASASIYFLRWSWHINVDRTTDKTPNNQIQQPAP